MLLQGGLTVRHKAHNLEIGGSIPPPALIFLLYNMKKYAMLIYERNNYDKF